MIYITELTKEFFDLCGSGTIIDIGDEVLKFIVQWCTGRRCQCRHGRLPV
jgi:hypothetical protein